MKDNTLHSREKAFRCATDINVSVILPVYNVGTCIARCIKSLQDQTMDKLEFIVVDDCSTDGSMAAIEAWADCDERVRILRNEENLGPGPSRNRGIGVARGDYLSFVDPDDYVSPEFYELLYTAATAGSGYDIAKGLQVKVGLDGLENRAAAMQVNAGIAAAVASGSLPAKFNGGFFTALYSRALFDGTEVRFGSARRGEDSTFLLLVCLETDSIIVENRAEYFYVARAESAMNSKDPVFFEWGLGTIREFVDILAQKDLGVLATECLAQKCMFQFNHYRKAATFGSELHAGYLSFFERFMLQLDPYPNKKAVLDRMPIITHLYENRNLAKPGQRSFREGEVRVSVVLAVCNAKEDVLECIESLRHQLLGGLEFIFVDDCSTDGSMLAVEAWASEDDRVRILRNEESLGVGPSLNRGIKAARGDYLSFVNPEDRLSPEFYELLYAAAIADGGHDIAKGLRSVLRADGGFTYAASWNVNKRIRQSLQSDTPLWAAFTSEHTTAIYRRALFTKGARFGAVHNDPETTFLLSATLATNDIVLAECATSRCAKRTEQVSSSIALEQFIHELNTLAENATLLEEVGTSQYAREYLEAKAGKCLTSYYMGKTNKCPPMLADDSRVKACTDAAAHSPMLQFLLSESPAWRAFVEQQIVLPKVDYLPAEFQIAGALDWLGFVGKNLGSESPYVDECAEAMVGAMEQLANQQGKSGFVECYTTTIKEMGKLPVALRSTLWLKVHRRLASKRSLRRVLKKAKRKILK